MISKITETVYIGDVQDCPQFASPAMTLTDGARRMNVMLPNQVCPHAFCRPFPMFSGLGTEQDPVFIPVANLDAAARYLEEHCDKPILVHCLAGIERSPLTVVWWLHKFHGFTIDRAYAFVQERRPMVQRRESMIRR